MFACEIAAEDLWLLAHLAGAPVFLTVRSYVSTARKHGVDPLHASASFQRGSPWLAAPAGP
jgi:hypothetical protein